MKCESGLKAAVQHLRRKSGNVHIPDIVLNSTRINATDETSIDVPHLVKRVGLEGLSKGCAGLDHLELIVK